MDIREVRHQSNQLNEPQDRGHRLQSLCPDCSSPLVEGDRFCQECGARVTANRAKKHAREIASEQAQDLHGDTARASQKTSELGRGRETQFTANILCINCGAKNSPVSADCNVCKKALVPDSDGTGRKTFLRDFLVQGKPQRRRFGKSTTDRLPVLSTDVPASDSRNGGFTPRQRIPRAFTSARAEAGPENDKEDDLHLLFSTHCHQSEDWAPETKHDRIAAEKLAYERSQRPDPAFGKLIVDSGADGFSLTAVQMAVEAFFERIPVPILLFVASMIIIFTTIHLTTEWQKQEQRLSALDKLASHAEDDMKAYKLDDAVIAMTELEKTEAGNLPPRARSVLNQSLWLRAYAYAKKNRYDLAIEDMKRVTPVFNSFDDASEKLQEYKEEVKFQQASAKNLPRPSIGPADGVASSSPDLESTDDNADVPTPKKKKSKATSVTTPVLHTIPTASQVTDLKSVQPVVSRIEKRPLKADSSTKAAKERIKESPVEQESRSFNRTSANPEGKEGKMNPGVAQASDSKRYSNLLIKYFSEAHDSEPPSFEEWQSSGKKDF